VYVKNAQDMIAIAFVGYTVPRLWVFDKVPFCMKFVYNNCQFVPTSAVSHKACDLRFHMQQGVCLQPSSDLANSRPHSCDYSVCCHKSWFEFLIDRFLRPMKTKCQL